MTEEGFTDPVTGQVCTVVDDPTGPLIPLGVAHPGCPEIAETYPHLDAFYCPRCGHNGRVTGAWLISLLPDPGKQQPP